MARKNRTPEENARREKIRELLQMANIDSMDDIQNLFNESHTVKGQKAACKTATGKAELKAAYEAERGRFQH